MCYTQALAPEYSLSRCNLLEKATTPNAQLHSIPLQIVGQDANDARLVGPVGLVIELRKIRISADISQGGQLEYTCE